MPSDTPSTRCSTNAGRSRATRCSRSPRSPSTSSPTSSRSPTACGSRTAGPRSSSRASSTPSRARAPKTARSARSRRASTPTSTSTRSSISTRCSRPRHATRDAGATQFCIVVAVRGPEERLLRKVIDAVDAVHARDRPRGRVLARAPHRGAGAAPRGRGREPLQPQPRDVPRGVPVASAPRTPTTTASPPPALAIDAGMELCCGGILGMGETLEQRVDFAFELAELEPCEVPINLLTPDRARRSATQRLLSPREALQAIALFRLVLPSAWLRLAGGRERVLGELQAMGLLAGRQRADRRQLPHARPAVRAERRPRAARRARHAGRRRPRRRPLRRRRRRRARPPRAARRASTHPRPRRVAAHAATRPVNRPVRQELARGARAGRGRTGPTSTQHDDEPDHLLDARPTTSGSSASCGNDVPRNGHQNSSVVGERAREHEPAEHADRQAQQAAAQRAAAARWCRPSRPRAARPRTAACSRTARYPNGRSTTSGSSEPTAIRR